MFGARRGPPGRSHRAGSPRYCRPPRWCSRRFSGSHRSRRSQRILSSRTEPSRSRWSARSSWSGSFISPRCWSPVTPSNPRWSGRWARRRSSNSLVSISGSPAPSSSSSAACSRRSHRQTRRSWAPPARCTGWAPTHWSRRQPLRSTAHTGHPTSHCRSSAEWPSCWSPPAERKCSPRWRRFSTSSCTASSVWCWSRSAAGTRRGTTRRSSAPGIRPFRSSVAWLASHWSASCSRSHRFSASFWRWSPLRGTFSTPATSSSKTRSNFLPRLNRRRPDPRRRHGSQGLSRRTTTGVAGRIDTEADRPATPDCDGTLLAPGESRSHAPTPTLARLRSGGACAVDGESLVLLDDGVGDAEQRDDQRTDVDHEDEWKTNDAVPCAGAGLSTDSTRGTSADRVPASSGQRRACDWARQTAGTRVDDRPVDWCVRHVAAGVATPACERGGCRRRRGWRGAYYCQQSPR